jgi:hypothetical protein
MNLKALFDQKTAVNPGLARRSIGAHLVAAAVTVASVEAPHWVITPAVALLT